MCQRYTQHIFETSLTFQAPSKESLLLMTTNTMFLFALTAISGEQAEAVSTQ